MKYKGEKGNKTQDELRMLDKALQYARKELKGQ